MIPPHWADHRFQGKAVLPAVEAMQLLAHWTQHQFPELDTRVIRKASFDKFLLLAMTDKAFQARYESIETGNRRVHAALITKTVAKTMGIRRPIVHAQMEFGNMTECAAETIHECKPKSGDAAFFVCPDRLYAELVPFGPAYRNIGGPLKLWPQGAQATIQAPDLSDRQTLLPLGSPFVLDAAFHAACVWSQRYADVVAFPVGIDERFIIRLTSGGNAYRTTIKPVSTDTSMLVFDIYIYGSNGPCCEVIKGVHMRDVSGGRLKPPPWIRATQGE